MEGVKIISSVSDFPGPSDRLLGKRPDIIPAWTESVQCFTKYRQELKTLTTRRIRCNPSYRASTPRVIVCAFPPRSSGEHPKGIARAGVACMDVAVRRPGKGREQERKLEGVSRTDFYSRIRDQASSRVFSSKAGS